MFARWLVAEIIVTLVIISVYLFGIWRGIPRGVAAEPNAQERELGSTVILSQLTGVITASTVIFGLLGGFALLAIDNTAMTDVVKSHIFYSITWALLSVAVAVYYLSVVPSYIGKYNVAKRRGIAIGSMLSLLFFFFALVRFWAALRHLLF